MDNKFVFDHHTTYVPIEKYENHRMSADEYFMNLAISSALRGTCKRRKVGCVLVDDRGHIIGTGYNGNARGHEHCIDSPCKGALLLSGSGLDACEAIHAEINALIHCADIRNLKTIYTTTSPCIQCVKALLASNCQEIVFKEEYPHPESKILWIKTGRIWRHYETK